MNPPAPILHREDAPSSMFFQQLMDIVKQYGGPELLDQFLHLKKHQENYLNIHWEDISDSIALNLFRDIDYSHILSLLRDDLLADQDQLFLSHQDIANLCFQFGEYQRAREVLSFLYNIVIDDTSEQLANLRMMLAKLSFLTNDWEESRLQTHKALKIFEDLGDQIGRLNAYNNLGILAYEQWQTEKGKEYFTKAQSVISSLTSDNNDNQSKQFLIQSNLGVIEDIQGNSREAYRIFEQILESIGTDQIQGKASVLIGKGISLRNMREFTRAKSILLEALELANQNRLRHDVGLSNMALADVETRLGEFEPATAHITEAFTIFSKLQDHVSLADTYRVFGMLYREQGNFSLAESQLRISLTLNEQYHNLLNLSETYYEYSILASKQDDESRRKHYLKQAIHFAQQMDAGSRIEKLQKELATLTQ